MALINEDNPKVYIIVLNWNGWADTLECLDSVIKTTYPNYHIVVVDNGSTDDSVERIRAWSESRGWRERLTLIETNENLGYAGGNNLGLRYAIARDDFGYVWILNNDTIVDPAALTKLVSRLKEKNGAGLCGSMVMDYHDRSRISALGGGFYDKWLGQGVHPGSAKLYEPDKYDRYLKMERKINYIEGASTLVSRELLLEVGLMSEEYFLYFEEIDWATRGRRKNYSLAIASTSFVYHKGGASITRKAQEGQKKIRFGTLADYYQTRGRLIFAAKYYPYTLPIVFISILGYCLDRLLHGAWINVAIISRGVVDAVLGVDSRRC